MKTVREVKKIIAEHYNDRKKGISVSLWQPEETDMDRIVIKFPRTFDDFIGFTWMKEKILDKNGFHVAQIMGFMDDKKFWILLIRDRR
jgi:hypothetical protein